MNYAIVEISIKSVVHGKNPELTISGFTGASIFHWLNEKSQNRLFKQKYTPEKNVSDQPL